LEGDDRLPGILIGFPINDTRRQIKPIEQHFCLEHRRPWHLRPGRIRARRLIDCRRR
jgi:hypothetical protein